MQRFRWGVGSRHIHGTAPAQIASAPPQPTMLGDEHGDQPMQPGPGVLCRVLQDLQHGVGHTELLLPISSQGAQEAAAPHLFTWGTMSTGSNHQHKLQPLNKKFTLQHHLSRGFAVHPLVQRGEQENLGDTRAHMRLSNTPA